MQHKALLGIEYTKQDNDIATSCHKFETEVNFICLISITCHGFITLM